MVVSRVPGKARWLLHRVPESQRREKIVLHGNEITALDEKQLPKCTAVQLVFQDPARSLNPRFSALEL